MANLSLSLFFFFFFLIIGDWLLVIAYENGNLVHYSGGYYQRPRDSDNLIRDSRPLNFPYDCSGSAFYSFGRHLKYSFTRDAGRRHLRKLDLGLTANAAQKTPSVRKSSLTGGCIKHCREITPSVNSVQWKKKHYGCTCPENSRITFSLLP